MFSKMSWKSEKASKALTIKHSLYNEYRFGNLAFAYTPTGIEILLAFSKSDNIVRAYVVSYI
jgi:hypothetical protein